MSRTRSGRGDSADAASPSFGLGISMNSPTASTPNRSPLRRRRSQTDSDYTETPSVSRATSTSRAGSAAAVAASRSAASPTRNTGSASDAGLAPEPPAKRSRGRPRKSQRPTEEPAHLISAHTSVKQATSTPSSTTNALAQHSGPSPSTQASPSYAYIPYDLSSNIIIDEERPIRSNNGKVTASRNARASAAAEMNRKAIAAREAAAAAALAAEAEAEAVHAASLSSGRKSEQSESGIRNGRKRKSKAPEAAIQVDDSSQDEDDAEESVTQAEDPDKAEVLDEAAQQEREEMFARWHEEYYEIVEQLPLELTRCFTLMREMEGKVQGRIERIRKAAQTYYSARKDIQSWSDHYVAKARQMGAKTGQDMPEITDLAPASSIINIQEGNSTTSLDPYSGTVVSPTRLEKGKDRALPENQAAPFAGSPDGKIEKAVALHSDDNGTTASNARERLSTTLSQSFNPIAEAAVTGASHAGGRAILPMPMGLTQRLSLLNTIAKSTNEAKKASEEKVELARTACELIDRLMVRLDSDLSRHEVGMALGLRKGTEESRGARETLGALTLAPNGGAGEAGTAGGTSTTDLASDAPDGPNVETRQESATHSKNGAERDSRADSAKLSEGNPSSKDSNGQKAAKVENHSSNTMPSFPRGTQSNRRKRVSSKPSSAQGGASKDGMGGGQKAATASGSRASSRGASTAASDAAAAIAAQEAEAAKEENVKFCYCDDYSQGEMVSCDNVECPREWFHFECVGMPPGLPRQMEAEGKEFIWYCQLCKPNFKGPGRKVPPNAKFKPQPASSRRSGGGSLRS